MAASRVQNARRNLLFGMVNRAVAMLMPFLSRTALIYVLGMEYAGLSTLFTNILQVLNLADLGIGTAIVYALYEPVANDDVDTIRALMNYYRRVYRAIGCVIAVLGLALLPFLPHLIKGEPPQDVNLTILYLVYLANTVISYWLFAYKQALPTAMQRVDVVSNVNTITNILLNLTQVVVVLVFRNYYAFLVVIPLCTVLNNLLMSWHVDRTYPGYRPQGTISAELRASIRKRVAGLTIQRVCATTRNALDSVFLSAFIGLTITAIYSNYLLIMSAVTSILGVVSTAVLPTVGNSIVTDTTEKNYNDMRTMNYVYMMASGWCASCMLCLYQPFMRIWMGEANTLGMVVVVLIVLYFYGLKMGDIISLYASGSGLWWEMRWRSIAESVANIALNYLFVQVWGVAGIVVATLVSLLIFNFVLATSIIFKYYFKNGRLPEYFLDHLHYFLVSVAACFIAFAVCSRLPEGGLMWLLVRAVVCGSVTAVALLAISYPTSMFKTAVSWVRGILRPGSREG
ncbi:MAG: polysaccharide biosynthesis C-terminal domain-containing protein [Atopobiaceae bacterium]|nr:polysaccharide biosynthesis C-terminal domain-containing protein [Atopobiaceae bacterium]